MSTTQVPDNFGPNKTARNAAQNAAAQPPTPPPLDPAFPYSVGAFPLAWITSADATATQPPDAP